MNRENDLLDLGVASDETKGQLNAPGDEIVGGFNPTLTDD